MATSERVVLLLCHGGGFNKESWAPIVSRVQVTTLLQRVPCEVVALDCRYHGERSDDSTSPIIKPEGNGVVAPFVDHPVRVWTEWAHHDVLAVVRQLREDDTPQQRVTRIIGIGHSMGATTLLQVETTWPGSLDGLIVFEPVCNSNLAPKGAKVSSFMVANTLKREAEWDAWEDVERHFATSKAYRRWHKECTAAYLKGAIQRNGGRYRLAMSPAVEASVYCHTVVQFTREDFSRAKCKVVFEYGSRTLLFRPKVATDAAVAFPGQFFAGKPIEGASHLMVMEDPDACAARIAADLELFPAFQATLTAASKL